MDWPQCEKTCAECPAEKGEDGYCEVCKTRPLEEKFSADFRAWVENLQRLYLWHKAGYALESEGLSFEEWQVLGYLTRYYELKDLEALAPRTLPA
ncbi:MAG: hypothetical protein ACE15B_19500 [Bryobacteraceae bacterium]